MKKQPLLAYFALAFVWIWGIAAFIFLWPSTVTAIFGPMSGSNSLFVLAVWGPNIVALGITAYLNGKKGVLDLLRKYAIWRVNWRWYVFVLLGLPAIGLAAALLAGTFSTSLVATGTRLHWDRQSHSALLALLVNLVITGAMGEEMGWRGFALPRLLQRWNPLVASLILGLIWGFWHLPGFLAAGTPQNGLSLPAFVLGAVALSVIATWIYLHTGGSLLLVALVHFMANFSLNGLSAPMDSYAALLSLLILAVIALDYPIWFPRKAKAQPVTHSLP